MRSLNEHTGRPSGPPVVRGGLPVWVPHLEDERSVTRLRRAIWAVLALSILTFVVEGANSPADPFLVPESGAPAAGRTPLPGFDEVAVTVRPPDGGLLEWCLLLARTQAQRARGLMEVTDPTLGGYDGMLFRFDTDSTVGFYMRNTPMPLSIAYIDSAGLLVSRTDMEPCEDVDNCPTYPPAGPYRWAVEVPEGGLDRLGLVEGSIFTDTGASCPAAT